ncbi:hypothetical protein VOLCADRAFT_104887 [Volvox carteri f. nagariensis]|uniref:Reverse transcriptase domain-containing protein n=1 Tax=Volvox carteri f. nagariensis TaxID=3068 RepID=D8TWS9_VOLCA|nr:uncharacterized protein VOLCADRAFT_104887 [Volvox carteri f. nagariensis]EFJ48101.1 hypothetical protein VOLCADRAFT_104887 [Volvox carteri f. nagariensis]|eukprot:XP_002950786.1 hypothetical protein VOLCADRAFT_104887 [Volvox carteri f. nagariensis]
MNIWRGPLAVVGKGRKCPSPPISPHQFFPVSQTERPSRPGARVLPYLDDFLIMFTSEEQACFCARWVRESIEFWGLSCHPTKCQWEPSQSVYHLGITVNTAAGVFEVPKQKLAKLWWLAIWLRITAKRLVQKCELAKFCSFAQSIKLALTPALLFLRNCYDDVKQPAPSPKDSRCCNYLYINKAHKHPKYWYWYYIGIIATEHTASPRITDYCSYTS